MMKKNIAVIGAGAGGLTAIKSLQEEGHSVTCFEKSPAIGGIYRLSTDGVGVYDSTLLTSSAFLTSYSDFAPGPKPPHHFKHQEFYQYLQSYAAEFNLIPSIKFNHTVKELKQLPNKTWELTAVDEINHKEAKYIFDAVAVCSGVHQHLSIPQIPGLKDFRGEIIHAGHYRKPDSLRDKKVVIVGGGESASDIVYEISQVTRQCVLSLRRGTLIVPRLIFNRPNDFFTTRLFYTVPAWFARQRHKRLNGAQLLLLILVITTIVLLFNLLMQPLYALAATSRIMDLFLGVCINIFTLYLAWKIFHYLFIYLGAKELQVIRKLSRKSLAGHGEQFAVKCQGIAKAIASKKCEWKPAIKLITSKGVEFEDKTSFEADTIIFCTGYETRFPFLGNRTIDCRDLYKNCFDPAIGSSLCFIGLARPGIGSIPPIAEMQSRWFAQILSGTVTLPGNDVVQSEIKNDATRHKKTFAVNSDRITGLVDFTSYMDELAGFIGCRPQMKELSKDPFVLFRVYFNPFLACQYRLTGPHAKKDLAKNIMGSVPMNIFQFGFGCFYVGLIAWCSLIYRLGFKYFKPQLPL